MKHYIVNNNDTLNPGRHHEVHTLEHSTQLNILSYIDLGYFNSAIEAKQRAKAYYRDADGCAICRPEAHEG